MNILFSVNPLGLEGFGATLSSLIQHCATPNLLEFHIFCSGLSTKDKRNITLLLNFLSYQKEVRFIDFDARNEFGHLKSLHGDWTTYGRLLAGKYITSDTALYLDTDLIVSLDVMSLENFEFNGHLLAAVHGSTVTHSLEKKFLIDSLNIHPETSYFNAGVLLLNLKLWRESNMDTTWSAFAKKYAHELLAVDQTLLNALCQGKFVHLPLSFNTPWYAVEPKPENADSSIVHFVGSPKPWDMFGSLIHQGHTFWKFFNPYMWNSSYGALSAKRVLRFWKIRKSLGKHFLQRFQHAP